eukprot:CAMPEP_0172328346 /NCGR_PEP_ID=MMETSP1058-20130122/60306_1 /TAXON_ID=83371 /ORGANISM="Detonula confervacea, Strain CCMP 353" /LENGTH=1108 /DNA_ID=CAMNT_0013045459 /DNA_START=133 /DNA_END=3456 /DNA_ORIENTATION=+
MKETSAAHYPSSSPSQDDDDDVSSSTANADRSTAIITNARRASPQATTIDTVTVLATTGPTITKQRGTSSIGNAKKWGTTTSMKKEENVNSISSSSSSSSSSATSSFTTRRDEQSEGGKSFNDGPPTDNAAAHQVNAKASTSNKDNTKKDSEIKLVTVKLPKLGDHPTATVDPNPTFWKRLFAGKKRSKTNVQKKMPLDSSNRNSNTDTTVRDNTAADTGSTGMRRRLQQLQETSWRKEWRGIHLPPSPIPPGDSDEEKKASTATVDHSKMMHAEQQDVHAGEPQYGHSPRVGTPEEVMPPLPGPNDNTEQSPSLLSSFYSSLFSPSNSNSNNNQPSIPLYPLLAIIALYLVLKHSFRKIFTYQKRTQIARSVKAALPTKFGGNDRQFVLSQEELNEQLANFRKKNKKEKTKGSSAAAAVGKNERDDNEKDGKGGDGSSGSGNNNSNGNECNGGDGTADQQPGHDDGGRNNNGNNDRDAGDSGDRGGGSNNSNTGEHSKHHEANNHANHDSVCNNDNSQKSSRNKMKLGEELENAQQHGQQLSSNVVYVNEREGMLAKQLSRVKKENDVLNAQLKQQSEQQAELSKARQVQQQQNQQAAVQEVQDEKEFRRMKQLREELENALRKVDQSSADAVCANERSEVMHEQLNAVKKEKETLHTKLEQQSHQAKMHQEQLTKVTKEKETLRTKLEQHQLDKVTKDKNDALVNDNNAKTVYLQWMKQNEELENANQQLEQLSSDVVCANEHSEMMQEELSQVKKGQDTLQTMLEVTASQLAKVTKEKNFLTTQLEHHAQQAELLSQLTREKNAFHVALEQQTMKDNEELEAAREMVEQLEADGVCATEREEMLREKLVNVKREKDVLAEELERQTEVYKVQEEFGRMKANEELEEAHQRLEQLASDVVCANEREDMLREKLVKVKREKDALAEELERQAELYKVQEEFGRMKANEELEEAHQRLEQLASDVVCANEREDMLRERLNKVKKEKEALSNKLFLEQQQQQTEQQQAHQEVVQKYTQQVTRITEENNVLTSKVALLEAENEEMDLELECLVDEMCENEGGVVELKGLEDLEFDTSKKLDDFQEEEEDDDEEEGSTAFQSEINVEERVV